MLDRVGEDRRFTDKPELDPGAVRSLPNNHPALLENRTLFPSTVVDVNEDFSQRLLVSGKNNRKLGERIAKGRFKNYALYGLSLEERATCPTNCDARAFCYGNGMQMARRHRIIDLDLFNTFLENEIREILADGVDGLMVRLHVLGDFPSIEYVGMWADLLDAHENLACYGYTHHIPFETWGGDEIGSALFSLKGRFPTRFRIRWSSQQRMPDGARIIDFVPDKARIKDGYVCPAQTDATACCSTCGLCWDDKLTLESIVFIKHGPKSLEAAAAYAKMTADQLEPEAETEGIRVTRILSEELPENVRPITALKIAQKREAVRSTMPEMRIVDPSDLKIENSYQRDLSAKSMRLIRKIVSEWDWIKFKPPIVAETDDGLFVIDGQHTAIAAASHPEIIQIPVMIVSADQIPQRARAFVAHNRDRLTMTPAQIFHGEIASGNAGAIAVLEIVKRAGADVPRLPIATRYAKPGQITAVNAVRALYRPGKEAQLERAIRIAVLARVAPIVQTIIRGIYIATTEPKFKEVANKPDAEIAAALAAIKNIDAMSRHYAAETGQGRDRACAMLIADAVQPGFANEAAA